MAEQGTHKPLAGSSNLPLATGRIKVGRQASILMEACLAFGSWALRLMLSAPLHLPAVRNP
jgi:hypothetical protein